MLYSVTIDHKPGGLARPTYKVGGTGMCRERAAIEAMKLYEFEHGAELACDLNNGDAKVSVAVHDLQTNTKHVFSVGVETRFWYLPKERK